MVGRVALVWLSILALAGCQGLPGDVGLGAELRVAGAQYIAGEIEAPPADGPAVVSVFNGITAVQPGERDKPVSGTLAAGATTAALGLRGDRGYWIVVAGPAGLEAPDLPTFAATLSFAPTLRQGALALVVRAVDAAGRFGAVAEVPLDSAPAPTPAGALVVRLRWDTEADLDLHVVTPDGVEVWARNINSWQLPPPGTVADGGWQDGGILDFDSNAGCVIDGRRQENVVWKSVAPPGRYRVLVDSASLCGEPAARWTVEAFVDGAEVSAAAGESVAGDARFSKGAGSGVQALAFDVPAP